MQIIHRLCASDFVFRVSQGNFSYLVLLLLLRKFDCTRHIVPEIFVFKQSIIWSIFCQQAIIQRLAIVHLNVIEIIIY